MLPDFGSIILSVILKMKTNQFWRQKVSKLTKCVVGTALLSSSLLCISAQAGLFSWIFGEKDVKEEPVVISEQKHLIIRSDEAVGNDQEHNHSHELPRLVGTEADYQLWLSQGIYNRQNANNYENFLLSHLGRGNVPPMRELLTTARSWQECGYEPYQVPPSHLWSQMIPTVRLYNELRAKNILPPQTQIRSVYRSPELNRCAGGAAGSKHMTNGAMDIWIPDYEVNSWQFYQLQDKLCQFWIDSGKAHEFGLGLYSTGAIHLDTQGYRKWGGQFSRTNSPCRYIVPKPETLYIDGYGWAN